MKRNAATFYITLTEPFFLYQEMKEVLNASCQVVGCRLKGISFFPGLADSIFDSTYEVSNRLHLVYDHDCSLGFNLKLTDEN